MLQKPGISGCRETGPGQARQSGEMLAGLESQEAVRRGENRSFSFLILANSHASIPRGGCAEFIWEPAAQNAAGVAWTNPGK